MMRANAVTSSREEDGRDDCADINGLYDGEQNVAAKYAIQQQQQATDKPDYPG